MEQPTGNHVNLTNIGIDGTLDYSITSNSLVFSKGNNRGQIIITTKDCFSVKVTPSAFDFNHSTLETLADDTNYILSDKEMAGDCQFSLFMYEFSEQVQRNDRIDEKGSPKLVFYTFKVNSYDLASSWVTYLRNRLSLTQDETKQKKFLVICNPFGGLKNAATLFRTYASPMFKLSGATYDYFETKSEGHGEELAKSIQNLSSYTLISVVGGDGLLHEVLNGLLARNDYKDAQVPLAMLPAGSGNGVSLSLGINHFIAACLAVIRGKVFKMDLFGVYTSPAVNTMRFTALNMNFGYLAEVDDLADKLRFLGTIKYDIASILLCLFPKRRALEVVYQLSHPGKDSEQAQETLPEPNRLNDDIFKLKQHNWVNLKRNFWLLTLTNMNWVAQVLKISETLTPNSGAFGLIYETNERLSGFEIIKIMVRGVLYPNQGHVTSVLSEKHVRSVMIKSISNDNTFTPLPSFRIDGEKYPKTNGIQIQIMKSYLPFIASLHSGL